MLRMVDSLTPAEPPAAREEKRAAGRKGHSWAELDCANSAQSVSVRLPRRVLVPPTPARILLWFADPASNGYRIFYSDLRTEVVTDEQKSKLVPKAEIVGEPQSE